MRRTHHRGFYAAFLNVGKVRTSSAGNDAGMTVTYYREGEAIPFAKVTLALEGAHSLPVLVYHVEDDKPDAAAVFHREKGCCDGSDPSACYRRQEDARKETERLAREKRRLERAGPAGEYEGTN